MTSGEHTYDHPSENCRRYLDNLGDYFEGSLSAELCRELEAHLANCENCRIVVNTLSKTISLYREMPEPELPSAVKERLFAVLDLKPFYHAPLPDAEDDETPSATM